MVAHEILTEVPDRFIRSIRNGSSIVDGVSIRSTQSGQYEGFLQQSSCHGRHLMEAQESFIQIDNRLAHIEDIFSVNATEQTARLQGIQKSLETLNLIAGVGTAAALINLGVSIGSFVVLNKKLKNIENKIDKMMFNLGRIENKIDTTNKFLRIINESKLHTALERFEDSFILSNPEEKVRYWRECERDLNSASNFFFRETESFGNYLDNLISDPSIYKSKFMEGPEYDYDSIEKILLFPTTAVQARVESLMLLQEPKAGRALYSKFSQFTDNLYFDKKKAYLQRREILNDSEDVEAISGDVEKTTVLIDTMKSLYKSKVSFMDFLIDRKIDTRQFVEEVRATKVPKLLFIPINYQPISVVNNFTSAQPNVTETKVGTNDKLPQMSIWNKFKNFFQKFFRFLQFWKK